MTGGRETPPSGGPPDDAPLPGLADLREVTPPPSLVPAVMRSIADPPPASLWSWLRRRRRFELWLSPVGFAAAALGVLVMAWVWTGGGNHRDAFEAAHPGIVPPGSSPAASPVSSSGVGASAAPAAPVVVRFVLVTRGAKKVAVAGDFNGWDPERTLLDRQDAAGTFAATVALPRGAHEYMFVVDGQWVTDPAAAERRPDGYGRHNAVLRL